MRVFCRGPRPQGHAQRRFRRAIVEYSKAIELEPTRAALYADRGLAKNSNGDFDGAIADYSKALELRSEIRRGIRPPRSRQARQGRRRRRHRRLRTGHRVDCQFSLGITIAPSPSEPSGDVDGAAADYNKAVALAPSVPAAATMTGASPEVARMRSAAAPPCWPLWVRLRRRRSSEATCVLPLTAESCPAASVKSFSSPPGVRSLPEDEIRGRLGQLRPGFEV